MRLSLENHGQTWGGGEQRVKESFNLLSLMARTALIQTKAAFGFSFFFSFPF